MRAIDMHCHIFPQKIAARAVENIGSYYGIPMNGSGTVADLLAQGKEAGIDRFLVHSTATKTEQVHSINDYIAGIQAGNPGCIGFGTLHPGLGDVRAEADRVISLGLHGIKLHPEFQNFRIDEDGMMPVYEALEGRLPVLMHMGDEHSDFSSPKRLCRVLEKFPRLTVIAAHLGGYRMWEESMQYLSGRSLYFDTSSSLSFLGRDRALQMIRSHGTDKVLFGSDYPMWSPAKELDDLLGLGLTQEEQDRILWKNACELLKMGYVVNNRPA